ncbi:MAG: FAD-dependent oxidoreductase [Flavobacteriales bacterium]|nr:FAD-dependent oxidoreductase [Flavobacteriales bacterium]
MKKQARVVVIGGGIAGCSTLYHLTKLGWTDVVLVDKNELTSGSTWLAAGNIPQYSRGFNLSKVHNYAVELYQTLEKETGQAVDWHTTGSIRLALNKERMLEYKHVTAKDKILGVNSRMMTAEELKDVYPLLQTDGLLGGLYHPEDGHVDPTSVTHAMAKGAKAKGAEIYLNNAVKGFTQKPNDEWTVHTENGDIDCEIVINCAGLWATKIANMIGVNLPIIAMEHHHILFDDLEELVNSDMELPLLRDPDTSYYMRQELKGLLIGPYEPIAQPWNPAGVPDDYASKMLNPNMDRIQDILMDAIGRVPAMGEAGIREEVNGPITYAPDGNPLVGPAFGVKNFFMNAGHCFGITQCAAAGLHVAEWVIEGETSIDPMFMDSRRYGEFADLKWAEEKVKETYKMMYSAEYPGEIRPAARNVKTTPIFDKLVAQGAVMSQTYGWERPNWFAPEGVEASEINSFKRTNWFEHVGNECKAVRNSVGVLDLSGFSKFSVKGEGAYDFLSYMANNNVPKTIGRAAVTTMLADSGKIRCDTTITKLDEDDFMVVTAAAAERHDFDWIQKAIPKGSPITIKNISEDLAVLVLAGPRSRDLISKISDTDYSKDEFKFATSKMVKVAGRDARALRLGFTGELGYELYCKYEDQETIYDAIMEAGKEFGIVNFGLRAMMSMRLEKGYCILGNELNYERNPIEAGLGWAVKFKKDFKGKDALLKMQEEGIPESLVMMTVEDDNEADVFMDEPVFDGDTIIGRVSSGGYGFTVQKSLALAYIKTEKAEIGSNYEIEILGVKRKAVVVENPIFDPANERLRG